MREIQIKKKNTIAYLLEWPKSGTLTIPNSGEECKVIGTSIHHSWECKIVQLLWKIVWWLFLKKKKLNLLCIGFSSCTLWYSLPKEVETYVYAKTCTQMFVEAYS